MLISEATANLTDAIEAHARGSYCIISKEIALRALIADEACVIRTGGYSDQTAMLAADWANEGHCLLAFLRGVEHARSYEQAASVVSRLVGVNSKGEALIADACAAYPAPILRSAIHQVIKGVSTPTGEVFEDHASALKRARNLTKKFWAKERIRFSAVFLPAQRPMTAE